MFCAEESLARRESLAATASTCRRWVLLEHPSAWGPRTLLDSNLTEPVAIALREWALAQNVRLVLIKQPERVEESSRTVFLVTADESDRVIERLQIGSARELADLDLSGYRSDRGWGLGQRWTDSLFLVCTHGRRDPCCAIQGNPIFNVLHQAFPTQVWKSSHIGGDRFAANLVSLPAGVMLGRLKIETAIQVVKEMEQGTLDLQHYRGRGFYPFVVQAAEHHLRVQCGISAVDGLRCAEWKRVQGGTRAVFTTRDGIDHVVTVQQNKADQARLLTCHSEDPARPPEYGLVSIE